MIQPRASRRPAAKRSLAAAPRALHVIAALLLMSGCNATRMLAPPPPLRAASAAAFAVDVEFSVPVAKSSAEDVTHYSLVPAGSGPPVAIASSTVVDTSGGRVVQLIVPDWLTTDPDGTDWTLTTSGVLQVDGTSTGDRSITFRAGLSYASPLKEFFDARCTSCHGPARADGSYRTDSLSGLMGGGSNATPNLVAGDPNSLLIRKCKPHNSMYNLANLTYFDFELIRNWVVSYNARP